MLIVVCYIGRQTFSGHRPAQLWLFLRGLSPGRRDDDNPVTIRSWARISIKKNCRNQPIGG